MSAAAAQILPVQVLVAVVPTQWAHLVAHVMKDSLGMDLIVLVRMYVA